MFESGYPFRLVTVGHPIDELPLIKKIVYDFRTVRKRRYLVHLHEYEYKVFVIKFHDVRHKNLPNRFNVILNDFDCERVLRTIVDIAQLTLNQEKLASFAFVGVPIEGKEPKHTANSQRHRIYKSIVENFLGSQTFLHGYEENTNCYLLVNKSHANPEAIYSSIVDMFTNEFQELDNV
jgi:hypothetical protein